MYKDFNSLIEGWSKNWFLGLEKNIFKSISASGFVLLSHTIPWLLLLISVFSFYKNDSSVIIFIALFSTLNILTHAFKRYYLNKEYYLPTNYWYLNGIGGIIIVYISLISIYKTYTGVGWTWKGRKLLD